MISDRKLTTNRENAQKSTGPRTTGGKAVVARNGVSHGLTGRFQLLDGESPASLADLVARLSQEHKPDGETELFLVRQLAELQIRLDRASSLESELMLAVVDPASPANTPHAVLARVFSRECSFDAALLRLNRYENALRRNYLAALRELRLQQRTRCSQTPFVDVPTVATVMAGLPERLTNKPKTAEAPAQTGFDKANPTPSPAPDRNPSCHAPAIPIDAPRF